jgi:ATP-dependent Clp protease adapter protein ClpS
MNMTNFATRWILCTCILLSASGATAFSAIGVTTPSTTRSAPSSGLGAAFLVPPPCSGRSRETRLHMSDQEFSKTTKKGVQTIIREKTEEEEDEIKEELWRVVLHNDEVHTFHYVVRSLTKCIGTLDRKAAFEVCVQTHGIGKATITKTWKKQAEQFCLGLQRQGLTVSISPDEDFDGGHSGGGY